MNKDHPLVHRTKERKISGQRLVGPHHCRSLSHWLGKKMVGHVGRTAGRESNQTENAILRRILVKNRTGALLPHPSVTAAEWCFFSPGDAIGYSDCE